MQITYQKKDGSVMQRLRNTTFPYKIGEKTSMGWKVLNIEYKYNNKYYSEYELNKLIYKKKKSFLKMQYTKKLLIKELHKIMYYIIVLLIINLIKKALGI